MALPIVTLIVLGILGFIDTGYLVWKQRDSEKKPLVCPIGEDCNVVVESKWNKIFFVRNDVLGMLFYILIIGTGIFLFFNAEILEGIFKTILMIVSGVAVLFSVILVYIQIKKIRSYCIYCLASALITLLIFLNVLFL